jgi:hypothetical protein
MVGVSTGCCWRWCRINNPPTKETRRVIFIDDGQDAVRSRVQAVKAIAQSDYRRAIVDQISLWPSPSAQDIGTHQSGNMKKR